MPLPAALAALSLRRVAAGAALTAAAAALWWVDHRAYRSGQAACEARHEAARQEMQRALFRAADAASARASELAAERSARAADARRLEDALRETAVDRCVPDPGSLQRLREHWAGRGGTAAP